MEQLEMGFIKGFNHGYQIAKHEPELIDQITKAIPANANEYCKGILSGRREYELEKIRAKKGKEQNTKEQDKDIERDR